jgi:uncharacterized protein YdaU (DUF1376 family)
MSNPWTPFYWRDYIGDTGHLSLMEHGAYLLLMAHYYMTGEPLPANAEQLHRICRAFADAERHACQSVLDQFFVLEGDVYRNARADEEIEKARKISEVRANAARSRHSANHANAYANAEQMHTQPQPQSQTHLQAEKAIAPSAPAKRASQMPVDFDLSDEMRQFARDNGLDAQREFDAFRDYHRSKGSKFLDWKSAWRTWIRNAVKFAGKGKGNAPPAGYLNETRDDLLEALNRQSGEVQ